MMLICWIVMTSQESKNHLTQLLKEKLVASYKSIICSLLWFRLKLLILQWIICTCRKNINVYFYFQFLVTNSNEGSANPTNFPFASCVKWFLDSWLVITVQQISIIKFSMVFITDFLTFPNSQIVFPIWIIIAQMY